MNLVKANPTITAIGNFLVNFVWSGNSQEAHLLSRQDVWNRDTAHSFLPLWCDTPENSPAEAGVLPGGVACSIRKLGMHTVPTALAIGILLLQTTYSFHHRDKNRGTIAD